MPQTLFWLVAGSLLAFLAAAWAFYVWKLGGFIEYINRPFPSLVVLGAAVAAGFAVYGASLLLQRYPSTEEIRKAPSAEATKHFYQTGETSDEDKSPDNSTGIIIRDDEEEKAPESNVRPFNPLDAKRTEKGVVVMDANVVWREGLQAARDNALLRARQLGLLTAVAVAALGYVVLMLVTPEAPPAPVAVALRPPAAAFTESDLSFEEGAPPREPSAAAAVPAPDLTPDTFDADPYDASEDAPINLDDLEKGYREYKQDNEDKTTR